MFSKSKVRKMQRLKSNFKLPLPEVASLEKPKILTAPEVAPANLYSLCSERFVAQRPSGMLNWGQQCIDHSGAREDGFWKVANPSIRFALQLVS